MTNIAQAAADESDGHPPLARDALGNLLPVPDGTAAWRICRQTTGRPRALIGPDGAAMRFPLTTTAAELVDLCGPGAYRIYALDEMGEQLEHVNTLDLTRGQRNASNANELDVPLAAALRVAPGAAPTTDLRFALHAVTEIARINGEALRAISDSQADWIKTLAMNKGLPRNVAYPMLPPPREERDEEPDERARDELEDDDDEDVPAAPTADPVMQFLSTITPLIPSLLADWRGKKTESTTAPPTAALGMAHLARVQQQLNAREREFLALLLADEENCEAVAIELAGRSVDAVVAMIREQCPKGNGSASPPRLDTQQMIGRLRERVPALLARLSPPVRARLLALAPKVTTTALGKPALLRKLDELAKLDDDGAAAWIEANPDEIEKAIAS